MSQQVCVIGAGPSGISALKSCFEEGLIAICYESKDDLGGTWNYKRYEQVNRARVYESLITNVSKEASCFSDFPYPKEYPPFFSHVKHLEYLKSYAQHFDLEKHIIYKTKVENVVEQNLSSGRRWKVTVQNVETSLQQTREFDFIIVCAGMNSKSKMPCIDGLLDGTFKGTVKHSCGHDTPEEYKDKKVLVIGLGSSGGDVAVDASMTSTKTILSSRSGAWILPRVHNKGLPTEMTLITRFSSLARKYAPATLVSWFVTKLLSSTFDLGPLGLRSKYSPINPKSSFIVSDDLPAKVVSGKVMVKPGVVKFDSTSAHFTDGTKEDVDIVICATGYTTSFPFLDDNILADHISEMKLFNWIFPYALSEPSSIAFVGLIAFAGGSSFPVMECQSRYVAQIMSGVRKLPSCEKMKTAFEKDRSTFIGQGETFLFKRQLGSSYQDGIAEACGFYPAFWHLFFRDPKLALAVYTGPIMSYHYRLIGRHTWTGARSRIMNCIPNTLYGINPNYRLASE